MTYDTKATGLNSLRPEGDAIVGTATKHDVSFLWNRLILCSMGVKGIKCRDGNVLMIDEDILRR